MTKTYEAIYKTLTPISHGCERGGTPPANLPEKAKNNYMPFRKMFVATESDSAASVLELPVISGNSMRGIFRRIGAQITLETLGLSERDIDEMIYYMFFSGGGLTKRETEGPANEGEDNSESANSKFPLMIRNTITLRALVPHLSLFGTAYNSTIMEGLLIMGGMLPIFHETESITGVESKRFWSPDLLSFQMGTRRDGADDEVDSLTDKQAAEALQQKDGKDPAKKDKEDTRSMIFYTEVLAPGVDMHHTFSFKRGVTAIEQSLLASILSEFTQAPYVGGKLSSGYGSLKVVKGYDELESPIIYLNFLSKNKETILEYLDYWNHPEKLIITRSKAKKSGGKETAEKAFVEWPKEIAEKLQALVDEWEIMSRKPDSVEAKAIVAKYRG